MKTATNQRGILLVEVLVAIAVFSIGILAMIHLQVSAAAAASDAQYRSEAGKIIDQLLAEIRIRVAHNPTTGAIDSSSLDSFRHRETTLKEPLSDPDGLCEFSGTAASNPVVTNWILSQVRGMGAGVDGVLGTVDDRPTPGKGLPGQNTNATQQILIETGDARLAQVTITLCWKAAGDRTYRSHSVVSYVD